MGREELLHALKTSGFLDEADLEESDLENYSNEQLKALLHLAYKVLASIN